MKATVQGIVHRVKSWLGTERSRDDGGPPSSDTLVLDEDGERLRAHLRSAFEREPGAPPELRRHIREKVRAQSARQSFVTRRHFAFAASGAFLVAAAAAGTRVWRDEYGHEGLPLASRASSKPAPVGADSSVAFVRAGVEHHAHCASARPEPASPMSVAAMDVALGPEHAGLVGSVVDRLPAGVDLVESHICRSAAGAWVHLRLREGERRTSILLTTWPASLDAVSGSRSTLLAEHEGVGIHRVDDVKSDACVSGVAGRLVYVVTNRSVAADAPHVDAATMARAVVPGIQARLASRA